MTLLSQGKHILIEDIKGCIASRKTQDATTETSAIALFVKKYILNAWQGLEPTVISRQIFRRSESAENFTCTVQGNGPMEQLLY